MSLFKNSSAIGIAVAAGVLSLACTVGLELTYAAGPGGAARGAGSGRGMRPAMTSRPALPDRAADRAILNRSRSDDIGGRTTVERTENGIVRTTTVTNGQGETKTSSTTVTRDPEAGARVDVERTGFDGATRTTSSGKPDSSVKPMKPEKAEKPAKNDSPAPGPEAAPGKTK